MKHSFFFLLLLPVFVLGQSSEQYSLINEFLESYAKNNEIDKVYLSKQSYVQEVGADLDWFMLKLNANSIDTNEISRDLIQELIEKNNTFYKEEVIWDQSKIDVEGFYSKGLQERIHHVNAMERKGIKLDTLTYVDAIQSERRFYSISRVVIDKNGKTALVGLAHHSVCCNGSEWYLIFNKNGRWDTYTELGWGMTID